MMDLRVGFQVSVRYDTPYSMRGPQKEEKQEKEKEKEKEESEAQKDVYYRHCVRYEIHSFGNPLATQYGTFSSSSSSSS